MAELVVIHNGSSASHTKPPFPQSNTKFYAIEHYDKVIILRRKYR